MTASQPEESPKPDLAVEKFLACMTVTADAFVDVHTDDENRPPAQ